MSDNALESPRTIQLRGPLTTAAARRVASEFEALRNRSTQPIAIHIHSPGGDLRAFRDIVRRCGLYRMPRDVQVRTVGYEAMSAAAYLLISGHHASAASGMTLHLHGTAFPLHKSSTLHMEAALAIALRLDRENRGVSKRLAQRTAVRLIRRYRDLVIPVPSTSVLQGSAHVEELVGRLTMRVRSIVGHEVLCDSLARYGSLCPAVVNWSTVMRGPAKRSSKDLESQMCVAMIDCEDPIDDLGLPPVRCAELLNDYALARDLVRSWRMAVLDTIAVEFGVLQQAQLKSDTWMTPVRLSALKVWIFAVVMSQRLLAADTPLSSADAFWMGLIDEVIG